METNNLNNEKKNILFFPSDTKNGVWYYRCKMPMITLANNSEKDFHVLISNKVDFGNPAELDDLANKCKIIIVHNGIFNSEAQDNFWKALVYLHSKGVKLVLDLDDYWDYGPEHPLYNHCISTAIPQKMIMNFKFFDLVSTTTEYFAEKIRKFTNKPVVVFPNGISLADKQFSTLKKPSGRIRIGLTGGASHTNDIKQLLEFPKFLPKEDFDKIELVFCGYDESGEKRTIDEKGKVVKTEKIELKDNWWWQTEQHWLKYFKNCESYLRIPTTKIDTGEYGHIYENIDILIVPLTATEFNKCKSELKFIEAGFTNTAIIASNTGPYRDYGRDKIDCELVKEFNPRAWAMKIHKLVKNNEYRKTLTKNLHDRVLAERNLEKISKYREQVFFELMNS